MAEAVSTHEFALVNLYKRNLDTVSASVGFLSTAFAVAHLPFHPSSFILHPLLCLNPVLRFIRRNRAAPADCFAAHQFSQNDSRITVLPPVWVEGEISNFKDHTSGHWYFTLKDEGAQIRAKCFRSSNQRIRFRPHDGLHVRARGKLSVFAPRGDYELVVESLDPVGAGALRIAFEQLRDRLQAEGLFAKEFKRPLPVFPRRVGIVTSPTGAAIRDILNVPFASHPHGAHTFLTDESAG
jgi:hypothetical protein